MPLFLLPFLKKYGYQLAIGVALIWVVKYYGTTEFEQGAAQERVQTTKDLEKNVQARYAAAVKDLESQKQAIQQAQMALGAQSQTIQTDRAAFNQNVAQKLSALDSATKGNITDASKTPDDQLNALARQWIARLSATAANTF